MRISPLPIAVVVAVGVARCSLPMAEIGQRDGPAVGRVFALITRDEILLTVSPPSADGGSFSIIGRGVCWTWPGADQVAKAAFGESHRQPNP